MHPFATHKLDSASSQFCGFHWNLQQAGNTFGSWKEDVAILPLTSVVQLVPCQASHRLHSIIWVHFIILFCWGALDSAASCTCQRTFFRGFTVNCLMRSSVQASLSCLPSWDTSAGRMLQQRFPLPRRRCSDPDCLTLVGKPGFHLIITQTSEQGKKRRRTAFTPQGGRTQSNQK